MVFEETRWSEWSEGKIPNFLFLMFFLSYSQQILFENSLVLAGFLVMFLSLFFSFSYALNDHCDRKTDKKKGKITEMSGRKAVLFLAILFLTGLYVLSFFPFLSKLIGLSMYFLSISYSAKPVRLKERGIAGVMISAVAQQTLSALLIFSLFPSTLIDVILFTLFLTVLGLRRIFEHQVKDFDSDKKSGVKTYAQTLGIKKTDKAREILGSVEQILLFILTLWIGWNSIALLVLPLIYMLSWIIFKEMREQVTYYTSGLFAPYLVLFIMVVSDLRYLFAVPLILPFNYRLLIKLASSRGVKI